MSLVQRKKLQVKNKQPLKISVPKNNIPFRMSSLREYLYQFLRYFDYYKFYVPEKSLGAASGQSIESASGQSTKKDRERPFEADDKTSNKRQQIDPETRIEPIGTYDDTIVSDIIAESEIILIPLSIPGLTPATKTITDCYTIFLVKIDGTGYTIQIVFTLVNRNPDNLIKLQKLIAVRVRSLVEKYNLQQIPLCLFGVIDCQLSELKYENKHKDLFNFRYLQDPLKGVIYSIIPVLTIPEYAILEFKIPDLGSKEKLTSLLTATYPEEGKVLIRILNNARPGHRALVYNKNNIIDHSQPPNPTSLMLDENNDDLQEYNSTANKEVVKKVLRNIRRNLFKVITSGEFDRFISKLLELSIDSKYSLSMSSGEVNALYSAFIDCQGATCSEIRVPLRNGGKTHKKRYNAKKINKSRKQKTNKSKKHTKGRKTRKSRRIR